MRKIKQNKLERKIEYEMRIGLKVGLGYIYDIEMEMGYFELKGVRVWLN